MLNNAFTPKNWYWLADDGRVFASARQTIVTETDTGFLEAQEGGCVTRWPVDDSNEQTISSLQAVLNSYGIYVDLGAAVLAVAFVASTSITKQVAATETHLAGYQSAANMVQVAGGVPTTDPAKSAFEALAIGIGMQPAQLATLVLAMDAASVQNLAILMTLQTAVAKSSAPTDLLKALNTYQSDLTAFVISLNSTGLTGTIVTPVVASVIGVNA